jgi:lipopolysaccharide export LptBFGC system permease protein LptF
LILGILISVIIYYITYFFLVLGANEKISTSVSVWGPMIIIILVISIGLVRINEK